MDFQQFIVKDSIKATHVIVLNNKINYFSFLINSEKYFNGDEQSKKKEREKQSELVNFYKTMEERNIQVYETFNLIHVPVFFRIQVSEPENEDILKIVYQAQKLMKDTFVITKVSELCCIVAKSKTYIDIMFPYSRTDLNIVRNDLRQKLIYLLDKCQITGVDPIVSETVYSKTVNILNSDCGVYKNVDDFNVKNQITTGTEEEFELSSWIEGFESGKTKSEFVSFSCIPRPLFEFTKEYLKEKKKKSKAKSALNLIASLGQEKIQTPVEILNEIKTFINPDRFLTFNEFRSLGQFLYNIYKGSEEGIEVWKYLARNCEYLESCEEEWDLLDENDKITIRTFQFWASKDNPEAYKEWEKKNMRIRLVSCLDSSSGFTDIACIIFDMYKTRFVCSSIDNKTWYEFKNHYWVKLESAVTISKIISDQFASHFIDLLDELETKYKNADPDDKEITEEWIKKCKKLISNLKNPSFKSNIIREACEQFYDEKFNQEINSNEYLIAFENGVLDFTETVKSAKEDYKAPIFRDGKPEDKITISTGYDYNVYTYDDPIVQDVIVHFKKVLTNTNVRNYFWRYASSILVGKNRDKVLPFFTGPRGNNGKSITISMFEKALGDYCKKVSYSMLTQTRVSSGAPTPDLVMCQYARMVVCQEADANVKIAAGSVKELTGNDSMQMRRMFSESENFIPFFKICCVSNHAPPYDPKEDALLNRIKIVEFNSLFTHKEKCPETEEEQYKQRIFPMDTKFDEKIKHMYKAFMWLMVQHYEHYHKEGLNEPKEVSAATNDYAKRNNHVLNFIEENLQESNECLSVKLDQVFNTYKVWYSQNFKNTNNLQDKSGLRDFLEKSGFKINRRGDIENCTFKS